MASHYQNPLTFTLGDASHAHTGNSYTAYQSNVIWQSPNVSGCAPTTGIAGGAISWPANIEVIRCTEHEIEGEVEMLDGTILGTCKECGETIKGRRMAGGLGLERFKMVLEGDITGNGVLAEEILRLQGALEAETKAIEDALVLLRLAEALLVHQDAA